MKLVTRFGFLCIAACAGLPGPSGAELAACQEADLACLREADGYGVSHFKASLSRFENAVIGTFEVDRSNFKKKGEDGDSQRFTRVNFYPREVLFGDLENLQQTYPLELFTLAVINAGPWEALASDAYANWMAALDAVTTASADSPAQQYEELEWQIADELIVSGQTSVPAFVVNSTVQWGEDVPFLRSAITPVFDQVPYVLFFNGKLEQQTAADSNSGWINLYPLVVWETYRP